MHNIMVNWVKEDEELLEPYEWCHHDDIEVIERLKIYRVNEKTLYDFIYGCIRMKEDKYYNQIFAVSDTEYCVIVEIDSKGTLIYRSLTSYKDRENINVFCKENEITSFKYMMYDEGMMKEYGLTRKERLKKQYVENTLDELYIDNYEEFLRVCDQLEIHGDKGITLYLTLKQKLEKGYTFLHELLYNELINNI
ncbi:MAG: hypothetical protein ACK5LC_09880 [Coprobacillaceae bacterium]